MMRTFLALGGAMLLIACLGNWPWITAFGLAIVLTTSWTLGSLRISNGIRQRLIRDCEIQHAALMRGDEAVGIYGRYQ